MTLVSLAATLTLAPAAARGAGGARLVAARWIFLHIEAMEILKFSDILVCLRYFKIQ
jgi:hypothetical protein